MVVMGKVLELEAVLAAAKVDSAGAVAEVEVAEAVARLVAGKDTVEGSVAALAGRQLSILVRVTG